MNNITRIFLWLGIMTLCSFAEASDVPQIRSFDGQQSLTVSHEAVERLSLYTVDVRLKSNKLVSGYPANTATTPQTPYRIGGITVELFQKQYRVRIMNEGKQKIIMASGGRPREFTRITVVGGNDGVILYINGGEAARSKKLVPLKLKGRIGAGNLKRFWPGEVAYFDVYDQMKTLGEFDPKKDRFDATGRIYALPGD